MKMINKMNVVWYILLATGKIGRRLWRIERKLDRVIELLETGAQREQRQAGIPVKITGNTTWTPDAPFTLSSGVVTKIELVDGQWQCPGCGRIKGPLEMCDCPGPSLVNIYELEVGAE